MGIRSAPKQRTMSTACNPRIPLRSIQGCIRSLPPEAGSKMREVDQRSVKRLKLGHEPFSAAFLLYFFHRTLTGVELSLEDWIRVEGTPRPWGDEGIE